MLFSTSHCHIQFPIYNTSIQIFKHVICEEIQLIVFLYRKPVYDVFPLRTLITFYSVDGNAVQDTDSIMVNRLTNSSNLIPVWHDDANRCINIEAITLFFLIDPYHHCSNHISLVLVDLICRGILRRFRCDEGDSACGQQIVYAILTSPYQR